MKFDNTVIKNVKVSINNDFLIRTWFKKQIKKKNQSEEAFIETDLIFELNRFMNKLSELFNVFVVSFVVMLGFFITSVIFGKAATFGISEIFYGCLPSILILTSFSKLIKFKTNENANKIIQLMK